jgi:hypothetical protein
MMRVAAASRCSPRVVDDYNAQIRAFAKNPPKDNNAALNARLGDIADILNSLGEEHNVLDSVCPTDTDKQPLFAQLNATTAWALVLQSDIAVKLNASCPGAAKALPAAMIAQAWLAVAASVNDAGGSVPKPIAQVQPLVQARATALGLTLPAYSETSAYWRDQMADNAKAAVAVCMPSPSPSPSGSPAPSASGAASPTPPPP